MPIRQKQKVLDFPIVGRDAEDYFDFNFTEIAEHYLDIVKQYNTKVQGFINVKIGDELTLINIDEYGDITATVYDTIIDVFVDEYEPIYASITLEDLGQFRFRFDGLNMYTGFGDLCIGGINERRANKVIKIKDRV